MGGDQMVEALTNEETERDHGNEIRETESGMYRELIDEVETMASSRELIEELKRRGHTVILASSAKDWEVDHYLDLLDARSLADGWTTSADVEATKPHPDLVQAALERAGDEDAGDAVMVGDTPWDVRAAEAAGVGTIAVLTGGFSEDELTDAGALAVFESVADLCSALDDTPLR
jgi:HAD superfamily hydrolase (TIGR01509 family)